MKQDDLQAKQRREEEEEQREKEKKLQQQKKRTAMSIVQTSQYEQQIKKLNTEAVNRNGNSVDRREYTQQLQLNDRKKTRQKFLIKLKNQYGTNEQGDP